MPDRDEIFRLLETADNFVKYAPPGGEERAARRARERYEAAAELAERAGDERMLDQALLRLADLERRALQPRSVSTTDEVAPVDRAMVDARVSRHAAERVPPGQRVTRGWPVLHEGPIPRFDPETWRFVVTGAVDAPLELDYDALRALDNVEVSSDFHCVTGWSKLDNTWLGVQARDVVKLAEPRDDAAFATVGAPHGYTANMPVAILLEPSTLLAWGHDGADLAPEHGWPLRLVVPPRYGWKSVKWVTSIELATQERRGFWEVRGYHNRADPWLEERYSYQES